MKYLFSILLIIFYVSNSNAKNLADHCDIYNKEYNPVWTVDENEKYFLDKKVHIINNTSFKEISFKKIYTDITMYHEGLDITFDKRSTNLCFEFNNFPYAILIEEKEIFNTISRENEKHLVFYIIVNVDTGRVYTISFNLDNRKEKPLFWGLALNEIENHYNWFIDKLTYKEAKQLHGKIYKGRVNLFWRGNKYDFNSG